MNMEEIKGRVWRFGRNIDTDVIFPGRFLEAPLEEAAPFVLAGLRPEFPENVRPGDIIVAGSNFGCGSSREQAPAVLKFMGVGVIVAESFGRIFFRNAIAIGLPVLACPEAADILEDGRQAGVNLKTALVVNENNGRQVTGETMDPQMLAILEKGGIMELLKDTLEKK